MTKEDLQAIITLSSLPLKRVGSDLAPMGIASACAIDYAGKRILLTAGHAVKKEGVLHLDIRYVEGKGIEQQPLPGITTMAAVDATDGSFRDIDLAFEEISNSIQPMWQTIDPRTAKILNECPRLICDVDFASIPSVDESYGFAGLVMPELTPGAIYTEHRLYEGLAYIGDEGDFYKFKLPEEHPGHDYFIGCSGAPIIDSSGKTVSLVCKGDEDTDIIYGISLKKYQVALEVSYNSP